MGETHKIPHAQGKTYQARQAAWDTAADATPHVATNGKPNGSAHSGDCCAERCTHVRADTRADARGRGANRALY